MLTLTVSGKNFEELRKNALAAIEIDSVGSAIGAVVDTFARAIASPDTRSVLSQVSAEEKEPEKSVTSVAGIKAEKAPRHRRTKAEIEAERQAANKANPAPAAVIQKNFEAADEVESIQGIDEAESIQETDEEPSFSEDVSGAVESLEPISVDDLKAKLRECLPVLPHPAIAAFLSKIGVSKASAIEKVEDQHAFVNWADAEIAKVKAKAKKQ